MNRSGLIALITTAVLAAGVVLELDGLRRSDRGTPVADGSNSGRRDADFLEPIFPLDADAAIAASPTRSSPSQPENRPKITAVSQQKAIVDVQPVISRLPPLPAASRDEMVRIARLPALADELKIPAQTPKEAAPILPSLDDGGPGPMLAGSLPQADSPVSGDRHRHAEPVPLPFPAAPPQAASEPAWWAPLVLQPQRRDSQPRPLDLATLVHETILHSEHVQAVSLHVQVKETQIAQADAAFDPAAFIDSRWVDISDPVGNVLTTGGPPRLSREEWASSVGFRRKTTSGGSLEVAQKMGTETSNSIFFVPANQATSRLTLSLNQPLLRGGGQAYNRSLVLLAMHDTHIARDRFRSELETHVLRVIRQYWEVYFQRCILMQQERALDEAEAILAKIQARDRIDSLQSQVKRARASVYTRNAQIVRAKAAIRNAEARLRALTNSPLLGGVNLELLPVEPLPLPAETLPLEDARRLAIGNRPEIDEALTRIRAAGVELGMSKNDMLPSLGLVLETYVAGLEGGFDLARSLGAQFSEGAPSYTAGILFEMPLGRRRAKALHQQKVLELKQAEHIFRDTVATLSSEVEVAVREVEASREEMHARREAARATAAEVETLKARHDSIPGEDHRAYSFALEELLNAIDRLVRDEAQFAEAQRNFAVSIAEFYRVTGMLVTVETQP